MYHFVLFPSSPGLEIAGKLGLSESLGAYKDKYVTEVRTETFRGDDRCAVKSRAAETFEAIWFASLAAAVAARVYLHVFEVCNKPPAPFQRARECLMAATHVPLSSSRARLLWLSRKQKCERQED